MFGSLNFVLILTVALLIFLEDKCYKNIQYIKEMYAKRIRCGWSSGCLSSPGGHKNHERFSLKFNEIWNYFIT